MDIVIYTTNPEEVDPEEIRALIEGIYYVNSVEIRERDAI